MFLKVVDMINQQQQAKYQQYKIKAQEQYEEPPLTKEPLTTNTDLEEVAEKVDENAHLTQDSRLIKKICCCLRPFFRWFLINCLIFL